MKDLDAGETAVHNTYDDADGSEYGSDMEEEAVEVGACVICYSVYLPHPEQPQAMGKQSQTIAVCT